MVGYDHGSVMQRGILEKYILYQTHVDVGVYHVSRFLIIRQGNFALEHYQGPRLALAHAHAGIDHCHHTCMTLPVTLVMLEETPEIAQPPLRSDIDKKTLYLVLKKNNEHYQTDTHEFIKNRSGQPHVENLRGNHPHDKKHQHAVEERECAAVLHHPVDVEEQQGDDEYVYDILYSEIYH